MAFPGAGGYGSQQHSGSYGPPPQSYSPQPQYNQYNQGYAPQPGYGYPPQQQYGQYNTPPPQVAPYGYNNPPPPQHAGYGGYSQPPPQPNGYPGPQAGMANRYQNQSGPPPPPANAQQFGHGAPSQYSFQYSQCTGRRKALLIGINYFGQRGKFVLIWPLFPLTFR